MAEPTIQLSAVINVLRFCNHKKEVIKHWDILRKCQMIIGYSIKRVAEQDRVRTKTRAWGTVPRLMIDATKVRWKAATKGTERELRSSASTRVKVEGSLCKKPSTLPFVVGWWGGPSWFIYFLIFFKIWPSLFICCLSIVMCSPPEKGDNLSRCECDTSVQGSGLGFERWDSLVGRVTLKDIL